MHILGMQAGLFLVSPATADADLETDKDLFSSATPDEGDTVTFEIEIRNRGDDDATNVSLTDLLPTGITYTGRVASHGSYDPGMGVWTIGDIADGGPRPTLQLSGTVDAGQGGNTITNTTTPAAGDQADPNVAGTSSGIVFIDASVADLNTLIASIDTAYEIVLLDVNRDGVEQIAEVLSIRSGVEAIHIVSHGDQAELFLGTARLTLQSMNGEYADELAVIGNALTDNADLLIYGCDFGEGEAGQEAASRLAELTGADVAASTDDTGHTKLGGDWELESATGTIEAPVAFSAQAQQEWNGLLPTETVADDFATGDYTGNTGTQNWSGDWVETDSGGGPGNIKVVSGALQFNTKQANDNIYREADLSGALTATLSFDYNNTLSIPRVLEVQASSNGGGSYTTLPGATFSGVLNTGSGTKSIDITSYIASNTRIRFLVTTGGNGNSFITFDNVQIEYTTAAPALTITKTADDITDVIVGQTITYTYDVTNTGNVAIADVMIPDVHGGSGAPPVPGTEILLVDNSGGGSTDAAQNGSWDTLAPSDVIRFTATYTVTQSDVDTLQ